MRDGHAEVVARRAVRRALAEDPALYERLAGDPTVYYRRPRCELHLFTTSPPCGDAAIYHLDSDTPGEWTDATAMALARAGTLVSTSPIPSTGRFRGPFSKAPRRFGARQAKLSTVQDHSRRRRGASVPTRPNPSTGRFGDHCRRRRDVSVPAQAFTGAKLGDWRREDAQVLGAVRLKPGRSDTPEAKRTCSLSCSDKICRWAVCDVQGALLRHVCPKPLRLNAVIVSLQPDCSEHSLCHALDRLFVKTCYLARRPRGVFASTRVRSAGTAAARDADIPRGGSRRRGRGYSARVDRSTAAARDADTPWGGSRHRDADIPRDGSRRPGTWIFHGVNPAAR